MRTFLPPDPNWRTAGLAIVRGDGGCVEHIVMGVDPLMEMDVGF